MFEKNSMTSHSFSLKKSTPSILLITLLVAVGGMVWFGIFPLKTSLLNKARMTQEFYADEENQLKQIGRLPELQNQYTTIENDASKLDILLYEGQVIDFIKTLETLASEANVKLIIASKDTGKIVEPKATTKKPPVTAEKETKTDTSSTTKAKTVDILEDIPFDRYLRLSISATGQYANIINFLHKIETLPVGLDVIGIEIKRAETEKKEKPVLGAGVLFSSVPLNGNPPTQPVAGEEIIEKNILEGVFDLVVYVNK